MSHVTLSQACETGVTSDINVTNVTTPHACDSVTRDKRRCSL